MTVKAKQPVLVGLLRGGAGAILLALIGVLVVQLGDVKAGTLAPYVPVAALALRTVEAYVLDQRKPVAKRRARKAAKRR